MYPSCDEEDAKKALFIAKEAFKEAKQTKLSQRIKWLEDVVDRLQKKRDV